MSSGAQREALTLAIGSPHTYGMCERHTAGLPGRMQQALTDL